MTREKMLEECVTPNEEVFKMCDLHYKDGIEAGKTILAHQIVEILEAPIDESNDYCTEICKKLNGIRQLRAIDELL